MFSAAVLALTLLMPQTPPAAQLPDTPQGRRVAAFVAAFNSGDEETFVKFHDEHLVPSLLGKITPERRREMFKRMQGDFGKMVVERVVSASARQIAVRLATQGDAEATLTFDFEEAAPFKISSIGVDIGG
jgi:hypothetical protein